MVSLFFKSSLSRSVAALALALTLSACGSLLSSQPFIVYALGEEGQRDLAVVRADGSEPRVVVAGPSDDFNPVWSPDRTQIAFLSNRDGNIEVYVASSDGSTLIRVTDTAVDESNPTWSPDGRRLAYVSPDAQGRPKIFWLELSNLLPKQLQFGSLGETDPAWSPDGLWIAYSTLDEQGNSIGLFLRNPRGVNRIQLTQSPDHSPKWSPDGRQLAFVSERDGNQEIYVQKIQENGPDGEAVRITDNPTRDFSPVWSPNGRQIAFLSELTGLIDVYTVSATGEDARPLTRSDVQELEVVWGQDGRLVFSSNLSGKPDLFVVDKDGIEQIQITSGDRPSSQPNW